jgi:nicotinamide-nucleotide amidase
MEEMKSPTCEIVTIGTELLLGQINDTNTTMLAQQLREVGVTVRFRTAAGDRLEDMVRVIREAVNRCDLVLITGGLGPTEDDLTRQAVADVAGVALEFRPELMAQIRDIFRRSGYSMPENNRRQAFVPEGSEAIPNHVGTAPAFITLIHDRPIISLPGVPRELKYLMGKTVLPWIRERFGLGEGVILYRRLKVVGLGESGVDQAIGDLMAEGRSPQVGLLASPGEITIRIAACAAAKAEALCMIEPVEEDIRMRLGEKVYGADEDSLEGVVEILLQRGKRTLAVVETFTGGLAGLRLHQAGAAQVTGNLVIPGRDAFFEWLGREKGNTPLEDAPMAAQRVREDLKTDLGLACVGFPEEREGVYEVQAEAAAVGEGVRKTFSWTMGGDRSMLQQRGSVILLNTLRLGLLDKGP